MLNRTISDPTINISLSTYKRLIEDSVRLQKCKLTISQLAAKLSKKSEELKKLKARGKKRSNEVSKPTRIKFMKTDSALEHLF